MGDETGAWDMFAMPGGAVIKTHGAARCAGRPCAVHNPSDHPLARWPMVFRMDLYGMVERTCVHGVGHPDPDSLAYFKEVMGESAGSDLGVHGCCGCCRMDTAS